MIKRLIAEYDYMGPNEGLDSIRTIEDMVEWNKRALAVELNNKAVGILESDYGAGIEFVSMGRDEMPVARLKPMEVGIATPKDREMEEIEKRIESRRIQSEDLYKMKGWK